MGRCEKAVARMENKTMKDLMKMMMVGAMVMTQMACFTAGEGEPEPWMPSEPDPEPKVELEAALDLDYISGHLGNYSSCPEKGYQEGATSSGADRAEPAGAPAGDFAPCEPSADEESCGGGLWNCEEAQLTIQLENTSSERALGVNVEMIELLDDDGMVRAVLPVNDVVVIADQMSFGGELESAEVVKLRLDYKGPVNLYEILHDESKDSSGRSYYNEARLRITVGADNADDVSVETKAVQVIPDVAT